MVNYEDVSRTNYFIGAGEVKSLSIAMFISVVHTGLYKY